MINGQENIHSSKTKSSVLTTSFNYTLGKSQNYKVHDNAIIVRSETSREGETNDRKSTLFRSAISAGDENTDFMNCEAP